MSYNKDFVSSEGRAICPICKEDIKVDDMVISVQAIQKAIFGGGISGSSLLTFPYYVHFYCMPGLDKVLPL